ncbi:MAG: ABC transporter ATP-binding protein [Lachnospiraceae bacterium]|nr:ABC transporter ATP-binding protein [Lachnospiraceae bacterium]
MIVTKNNTIMKIEGLTKYYGKVLGIENLSLELNKGEVFGIIGPNGAGKSTTMRSIMCLINKTSGKVFVEGNEFTKYSIDIKKIIGYLPSEIHLYEDLSVKQMLDYHESFYKEDIHNRRNELVELLQLDENKMIEDLSLGNLKKVGIVLAFMHNPKIIILDEPTSGLDPVIQKKFFDLVLEEKEKGTTILYSTHVLSEVSKVCHRVGIVRNGHLDKIETIDSIKQMALKYVTVTSSKVDEIVSELGIKDVTKVNDTTVRFKNDITMDSLVKKLAEFEIENLLIEEASLEDMFMHYYQEDDTNV